MGQDVRRNDPARVGIDYNTDRFQKSNDLHWLRLQVYF